MANQGRGADPAHTFERLAAFDCPPRVELLSALSSAFSGEPVSAGCDFELDELSRRLFGTVHEDAGAAAGQLAELLSGDPGFVSDQRDPRGLLIDRVLTRRAGHPLLLAVVLAEAGRRAGLRTGVFSSPQAWYAGVSSEGGLWVVETVDHPGLAAPEQLRGHCAHELAWAVLARLEQSHLDRGESEPAGRARRLRGTLPRQ